jgi:hypothetical protein
MNTSPSSDINSEHKAWKPQKGPQEAALRAAFMPELFFGGARGGGKSAFLMGDFAADVAEYGADWKGILFRRTYPELDELIVEGKKVLFSAFPGTEYKVGSYEFRMPNGSVLRLRHMENDSDADHYMGHAYCVAEGTPVWMGDGSYREIQDIKDGDEVMTLEGPRLVIQRHSPGLKECVDVSHCGDWVQSHPIDHPILTTFSWQSYASHMGSDAIGSSTSSSGSSQQTSVSCSAILASHIPGCEYPRGYHYGPNAIQDDNEQWPYLSSWSSKPISSQPSQWLLEDRQPTFQEIQQSQAVISSSGSFDEYLEIGAIEGSPVDYPTYPRFCGESALGLSEIDLDGAPSQAGAAIRALADCRLGVPGNIPSNTPISILWYDHPYTGELRGSRLQMSYGALSMAPCGEKRVFDLTVEEVNHYITTEQHLVNRNSWIGFDELTNWPNLHPYHRLKACLRSAAGVKNMRIRATGNPGGVGHTAVKKYFIDPSPSGEVIQDDQSAISRMFIRSRVTDNRILLDADPGYIDRLKSIGDEQLVKAWLDGDWNAFVGQYFGSWDNGKICIPSFEVPPDWPLFGSLDYGEAAPTSFGLATVDYDGNVYGISEYTRAGESASTHAYEISKLIEACPFTQGRMPSPILADPSMWVKRNLHQNYAHSPTDVFLENGLHLMKANNDRISGWRVMNDYVSRGKFFLFDGWNDSAASTIPSLPRSKSNPEDVDTKSNDHDADRIRYLLMHCFAPSKAPEIPYKEPFQGQNLIKELRTAHEELMYA